MEDMEDIHIFDFAVADGAKTRFACGCFLNFLRLGDFLDILLPCCFIL